MDRPILVVGATGAHGGTGATVAQTLSQQGRHVRALARSTSARTAALEALGVEIVTGDLLDRRTLTSALKDVEAAYFTYPVAAGVLTAAANFASAARSARVERVVVMSMAVATPDGPSHFGRDHWLAEEVFNWSGLSCRFLRFISFFYENIFLLHHRDIVGDGIIKNSFADIALPWIAGEDAGKIAASALLHPDRFGDQSVVYPTGGFYYRHSELAEILSRQLGRTIRHETISEDEWCQRLLDLSAVDRRVNADMARHISALGAAFQGRMPPLNNVLQSIVGQSPRSFEEVIESSQRSLGGLVGNAQQTYPGEA